MRCLISLLGGCRRFYTFVGYSFYPARCMIASGLEPRRRRIMALSSRSSVLLLCGALLLCPMSAPASPSVAEHRDAVVAHQLPARWSPCFDYGGIIFVGACR